MNKKIYPLLAVLVLVSTALACALPAGGAGQPAANDVETAVAATFQALTPVPAGGDAPAATEAPPVVPAGLLPQPLYFMNTDAAGIMQVFRLGVDGKSQTQVTSEASAVTYYDVSPVDGSLAYVSNNQLLLLNADGSGRRLLADGGPIDLNNPFTTSLTSPVFSPDGQTLAYSNQGLVLYTLSTGVATAVLQRLTTDPTTGAVVPAEMYIPRKFSPDGTKLLVMTAIPNSDGIASGIFFLAANSLVRLSGGDGVRLCCGEQAWSADSAALYVGISSVGMFGSGLWRVDGATGNLTTLLPTEAGGGAFNLAAFPYPAPDGNLYFFFDTASNPEGVIDHTPLQMNRSATDGVTGRTVLRPETFTTLNEALWAPDGSFVLTVTAPADGVFQGGILELYYTDSAQPVISLLPFVQQLKWGL